MQVERITGKLFMKRIPFLAIFIFLISINTTYAQQTGKQKEVLLIGTFHFNNPGADIAKTDKFNVLTEKSQQELQILAERIKAFAPDKIFVEWDFADAAALDSLYAFYVTDNYFSHVEKRFPTSAFYKENEIFQLAFRVAKLCGHTKVFGIDTQTDFPFDSLLLAIDRAKQTALKERIFQRINQFEVTANANQKKFGLTRLLLEYNKQQERDFNLGSYITMFNAAGTLADFTGPDLVASWYKRNLLMYSFVQKLTEPTDDKIMILAGAGHAALFKQFIDLDEQFKVVELQTVLNKK